MKNKMHLPVLIALSLGFIFYFPFLVRLTSILPLNTPSLILSNQPIYSAVKIDQKNKYECVLLIQQAEGALEQLQKLYKIHLSHEMTALSYPRRSSMECSAYQIDKKDKIYKTTTQHGYTDSFPMLQLFRVVPETNFGFVLEPGTYIVSINILTGGEEFAKGNYAAHVSLWPEQQAGLSWSEFLGLPYLRPWFLYFFIVIFAVGACLFLLTRVAIALLSSGFALVANSKRPG